MKYGAPIKSCISRQVTWSKCFCSAILQISLTNLGIGQAVQLAAVRVRHEVVPVAVMTAITVASRRYGRT